jgi:hypothetical protein
MAGLGFGRIWVLVAVTHPAIRSTAPPWWELVDAMGWVLSGTTATLWVLATFLRFGGTRVRVMDSLCENAYGMYLVRYLFAIWLLGQRRCPTQGSRRRARHLT